MNNPIGWIEIPAHDMKRAINFYNFVFGWDLKVTSLGDLEMALLPSFGDAKGASGTLIRNENYEPSDESGVLIYFTCEDVQKQIDRVLHGGGSVLRSKTQISPEFGYMALALDSEGNRIAFHSRK